MSDLVWEVDETVSQQRDEPRKLLLIGQPNVGKSLLFMRLTQRYTAVANYPGTTVEIAQARKEIGGRMFEVVDTPGTTDLGSRRDDERVTRDMLLRHLDGDVIQVGEVSNLRRTLLLTAQLAEHESRFILCLNMVDEAQVLPCVETLSRRLGVPVVAISALQGTNLRVLEEQIASARRAHWPVGYPQEIEEAVEKIRARHPGSSRGMALLALGENDAAAAYAIARARVASVDALLADLGTEDLERDSPRESLGRLLMHPLWGYAFLGVVLAAGWFFVGKLGAGTLVDFVQGSIFERFLNPMAITLVDAVAQFPHVHVLDDDVLTPAYTLGSLSAMQRGARFVHDLLVGPYGVVTMALTYAIAIVLPVILTFFAFFGLLEDSGYLPRLAVMLHRTFRRIGLNGKAVLPMVLGLGCDTMATLTTRILDSKKQATLVTLLLALGVPCSAQLGVILAMLAPLGAPAAIVWGGVTCSTILLVGWAASKVVPGEDGDFLLEIPPLRRPQLSNIALKVMARMEWYLREALPLFVIGTLLLFLLDLTGLLATIQRALSPLIVGALGLPAQATNAFVIGFLRRDYGAAGLLVMQQEGALSPNQAVVALVVITLFIPCVANLLIMIKERGVRAGVAIATFIVVYAFAVGWLVNAGLNLFGVRLGG